MSKVVNEKYIKDHLIKNDAWFNYIHVIEQNFDIIPDTHNHFGACNDISKKLVEFGVPRECAILLNNSMFKDKKISDDNIEEEIKIILRDNYQTLPYWTQVQLQFLIWTLHINKII